MKLTEWHQPGVNPVYVGVYETDATGPFNLKAFQHWNGRFWGAVSESKEKAAAWADTKSVHQNVKWRGLATPKGI